MREPSLSQNFVTKNSSGVEILFSLLKILAMLVAGSVKCTAGIGNCNFILSGES